MTTQPATIPSPTVSELANEARRNAYGRAAFAVLGYLDHRAPFRTTEAARVIAYAAGFHYDPDAQLPRDWRAAHDQALTQADQPQDPRKALIYRLIAAECWRQCAPARDESAAHATWRAILDTVLNY